MPGVVLVDEQSDDHGVLQTFKSVIHKKCTTVENSPQAIFILDFPSTGDTVK